MRKHYLIVIAAICIAVGTGCGGPKMAEKPKAVPDEPAEETISGEYTSQEDIFLGQKVQDIFEDAPIYETDNKFAVYRTNDREMDSDYEGDYLAIQDLENEETIYLPDFFGRILDMRVEDGGVELWYIDQEDAEQQEIRIPLHFSTRDMATDIYPYCEEKVLVQKEEGLALELEELPLLVWKEGLKGRDETYELTFERISPIYRKLYIEDGRLFADYCLTVKDETGNIISSQIIANYQVPYEEAYWLEDFSGDGIADIAFCTNMSIGTVYWDTSLKTLIWNEENKCYEYRELPECSMCFNPAWHREESVMIRPAGPASHPECWEMYSIVEEQWQRVRRLEPVYEPEEDGSYRTVGYREIFYQNGEILKERSIEERGSIWLKNEYTIDMYTLGKEWTEVSVSIGERTIDKVVRQAGR